MGKCLDGPGVSDNIGMSNFMRLGNVRVMGMELARRDAVDNKEISRQQDKREIVAVPVQRKRIPSAKIGQGQFV